MAFYNANNNLEKMMRIITGESRISLRIVDWFATNYAKKFYTLYEIYKNHPNFVEDYMIDHQLIMVVFKIKEKWKSTYEMFKQSKYSKMSKEYADMFKTVTLSGKVNIGYQYLIIHKHKDYREHLEKELDVEISPNAELMNIIDLTKETFDYARPIKIQLNEGQCQTS